MTASSAAEPAAVRAGLPERPVVRAGAVLAAAATVVFAATLALALERPVPGWERTVFTVLNGAPDLLHAPVWAVMQAGSLLAVPAAGAVAAWWGRSRMAVTLVGAGLGAYGTALAVKTLVGRARPDGLLEAVLVRGDPQHGLGFVSGHTAIAVALATAATPWLGRLGRVVVWTLAAVVGFGRIYVGAHLPLDVVGGAALGVVVGLAALGVGAALSAAVGRRSTPPRL